MPTLFSRIVAGEIPAHKIAENEEFLAFLDINPVQIGHTLIIPKREEDYFFDLTDDELARMMRFSKSVALAIQKATSCIKVGIAVVGLEINHAHLHLIPLKELGDMNLTHKISISTEELAQVATLIRSQFS